MVIVDITVAVVVTVGIVAGTSPTGRLVLEMVVEEVFNLNLHIIGEETLHLAAVGTAMFHLVVLPNQVEPGVALLVRDSDSRGAFLPPVGDETSPLTTAVVSEVVSLAVVVSEEVSPVPVVSPVVVETFLAAVAEEVSAVALGVSQVEDTAAVTARPQEN